MGAVEVFVINIIVIIVILLYKMFYAFSKATNGQLADIIYILFVKKIV